MKCSNCGAEAPGKFCEYCGSEMPQEKATVHITNHYYGSTEAPQHPADPTLGKCPRCGQNKLLFNREKVTTGTNPPRTRGSVSQAAYQTVGICQTCGYTWHPNVRTGNTATDMHRPKRRTWLWVLGWIFMFPVPLTILLVRNKTMKPGLKYTLIALAWIVYLLIGIGNQEPQQEIPVDTPAAVATVCQADRVSVFEHY